ncbi:hypothetical protein FG386_001749 [Cryptosporidium ryanae]|uniref:uncharacterized protein n=1 Tax=Cryptosporidium ryanae TaxID=515981 RepID=UPI00351A2A39|nr:hypothetical protein FG386_001749 [Cryptosporidium ryanae]
MTSIEDIENEFVSTPTHLKSLDEDLVVFAPDARKTTKVWDELEFIREDGTIFLEMPKSVLINNNKVLETKSSNTVPIINVQELSIGDKFLLTPELRHSKSGSDNVKLFRESILSTGITRNDKHSYGININYESLTTNDNDSDIESLFELNTYSIDNQDEFSHLNERKIQIDTNDLFLKVEQHQNKLEQQILVDVNISPIPSSLGKRQRSSPTIHSGSESPFELIHIMKKSLKLS